MKRKYLFFVLSIICVTFSSCDDYVDIKSEGKLFPEETENYRYLLNQTMLFDKSYGLIDVASDDIVMREDHAQYFEQNYGTSNYYRPFKEVYKLSDSIFHTGEVDSDLAQMYSALYNANVVISEVLQSNNGTEQEKAALHGEALVHRAYVFLNLVNIFGKAYDPATATMDPGIPMFTEPTVDGEITRATVQEVYDQILEDLTTAANAGLPAVSRGTEVGFPSQASAYALLARTYLYIGNYEQALLNAEEALSLQSTLLNMEDYADFPDFGWPKRIQDPELILSKTSSTNYGYSPTLLSFSDELLNSFDSTDLRYQKYTRPMSDLTYGAITEGRAYSISKLTGEARNAGPTVPEMLLIKAESLARAGDVPGAMDALNTLRQARFRAEDYVPLTATDAEDALVQVLEERRKELMGKGGFRWFDLKRLNKDPRFAKTFSHTYLGETKVLEPGGNRYQFPFASSLFTYAPNLEQNP